MRLGESDLAQLLVAVGLLLVVTRLVGGLFVRRRQSAVIGEIVSGLLLGSLALGALAPELKEQLLPTTSPVGPALGAVYHLGLVALMFAAGVELRVRLERDERVTAFAIATAGMAVPFLLGLGAFLLIDPATIAGVERHDASLALVFAAGIAVTSIPIISRVLRDLGLSHTTFARTVIAAAIVDDILLYGVVGIAVGLAGAGDPGFGLTAALGLDPASAWAVLYHTLTAPLVLASASVVAASRRAAPLLERIAGDVVAQLVLIFAIVVLCLLLNVPPLFGGLIAGVALARNGEPTEATRELMRNGLALLAPVYFAIVGLRVDLTGFDVSFFALFFAFAIAVKAVGVFAGARLASQPVVAARTFAIAMSARGGPGIVLASLAYDAGIINRMFFSSLVGLAVISTLGASWWLGRAARAGTVFADARPAPELSRRQETGADDGAAVSAPAGIQPG
jgi:K+:H+ antiporter